MATLDTLTSLPPPHLSLAIPPFSSPFPSCQSQCLLCHCLSIFSVMRLAVWTHRDTQTHIPEQQTRLLSLWGAVNVGLRIDPSSGFHDAKLQGGAARAAGWEASVGLWFYQITFYKAARTPRVRHVYINDLCVSFWCSPSGQVSQQIRPTVVCLNWYLHWFFPPPPLTMCCFSLVSRIAQSPKEVFPSIIVCLQLLTSANSERWHSEYCQIKTEPDSDKASV